MLQNDKNFIFALYLHKHKFTHMNKLFISCL